MPFGRYSGPDLANCKWSKIGQSGWGQTRETLNLLPVFVRGDDDPGEMIGQLRPEQTNPIPANTEIKHTHAKSTHYEVQFRWKHHLSWYITITMATYENTVHLSLLQWCYHGNRLWYMTIIIRLTHANVFFTASLTRIRISTSHVRIRIEI